jgi:hypothetical protein
MKIRPSLPGGGSSVLTRIRARLKTTLATFHQNEVGAVTNFIPTLWSARIKDTLDKSQVFTGPQVVNRDYEGEIRQQGDTVKINGIGDPTVSNYTRNTDIAAPEVLSDNTRSLVIDQAKYVNFQVDDLDDVQANADLLARATSRVAYKFRDAQDVFIAGKYVDAGNALGDDTTPIALTASNIYDTLVDAGVLLDEDNVPTEGRWVVLPPWAVGKLAKSDEFINAANTGETTIRNGFAGQVASFNVFKSNNVQQGDPGEYKIMAGTNDAITFAEQLLSVEAYRPERRFADAVKALIVYGAKVIEPNALVTITATNA